MKVEGTMEEAASILHCRGKQDSFGHAEQQKEPGYFSVSTIGISLCKQGPWR